MIGDAAQVLGRADPPQHDAAGQDRFGGHLAGEAEEHGRRLLGDETRCDQARGKIRGPVVGPDLPLDATPGRSMPGAMRIRAS